ncbi:hypothetical protein ACIRYZ_42895 [Kitasatospora sp. NPDC101155]|uniref:hypothetical protein n=1 Tax=Kitasatospora sp. NPDC101155 TaxID=3364097 RepID=UPI003809668D
MITQLASSIFGGSDAARRLAAPERLPSIAGDARPGVGRRGRDTSGPVHRHRSGRGDARVPAAAEQRRGGRPVVVGADTHARGEGGGSWWAPELDVGAGGRWWLPARSCADRKLPLPKNLPTKGVERQPDWANLCGLPGFAPATNPEARLDVSQQVTTGFAPIWSCTIGTNPTHDGRTKVFAITTDPRTTALTQKDGKDPAGPGRARWVAGGTLVVTCQGKDVFFSLSGGYEGPALFPDNDDLVRKFLAAGGKAIGCEPIL